MGVLITLIGGLLVFGFANDRFYLCVANVLTTCVFALLAWFGVTRESRPLMAVFFAFAVVEPAFIVGELYVLYNLSVQYASLFLATYSLTCSSPLSAGTSWGNTVWATPRSSPSLAALTRRSYPLGSSAWP